ncbi:MAG: PEP-CTERM sorting domain-containing protein [Proteobacteria bacterium]|nr:PEP-CTERM sorting domain-containing protein [Pseudomonadota bacterium]
MKQRALFLATLGWALTWGFSAQAAQFTFDLTGALNTPTPVGTLVDQFCCTGDTASWIDLTDPSVNSFNGNPIGGGESYGGDVPGVNLNTLVLDITGSTVSILSVDWYHLIESEIPNAQTITGFNDTTLTGGVGTLSGTSVTSWSSDPSGLVHNELLCVGQICGILGLPPSGTRDVVHDVTSLSIDSMEFAPDFSTVDIEITVNPDNGTGRQFYSIQGTLVPEPGTGLLLLLGLSGLAWRPRSRA